MRETTLSPYLRDIRHYPLLSHEDEVSLIKQFRAGSDHAAEKLITSNLRFVVSIAKKYQHLGLPLSDLINEGNIGLINAIEQFDETRGVKFSSYASWLIKRQIFQALADKSKIVRIPIKRVLALLKQNRKLHQLSSQLQQYDTSSETLRHLENKIDGIKRKLNSSYPYLSLDAPLVSDDDTNSFVDFISDDEDRQPDHLVLKKMDQDIIQRAITDLGERERTIIELYYGLHQEEPKTLKEIGEIFGITRERVRQIKENAIEKLRQSLHVQN
ncbi:sigma-70 family RNA polymerase sigma factor [candidate division KSB3 bacterium]|jgi:RNA polymerase primary sigma factor|uniref:Sigma-70 family RNA polymerase sigma factor n=1 Tax=candidate division KSB3 bacterium TaxID=2044937 RepID=A0A9D5Q6A8_9BACT|nr:sigma-70 family RNA polymerase sigma factor [candidate division KSB3 bacterium]MBD3325530.1 sigma-70 family RNA polymerase sigma factor [candidate division KSB3 bacterium]